MMDLPGLRLIFLFVNIIFCYIASIVIISAYSQVDVGEAIMVQYYCFNPYLCFYLSCPGRAVIQLLVDDFPMKFRKSLIIISKNTRQTTRFKWNVIERYHSSKKGKFLSQRFVTLYGTKQRWERVNQNENIVMDDDGTHVQIMKECFGE